jgi:ankyrin repeat protein
VRRLLEHHECIELVNVGTSDNHTPLHIAAVNGYRDLAQELIDKVIHAYYLFILRFFGEREGV